MRMKRNIHTVRRPGVADHDVLVLICRLLADSFMVVVIYFTIRGFVQLIP